MGLVSANSSSTTIPWMQIKLYFRLWRCWYLSVTRWVQNFENAIFQKFHSECEPLSTLAPTARSLPTIPPAGYDYRHCKTDKFWFIYKEQVLHCLEEGHCFVFRNWNTEQYDPRRIPTLLDCFQTFGLTENDKTTFLYRAFVQPVLKRAIMTKYGPPQSGWVCWTLPLNKTESTEP